MKTSEGFVFVRPGLHLYYRVVGEGSGDGGDPQRQLAGGPAPAAGRGPPADPLRPAQPRPLERGHRLAGSSRSRRTSHDLEAVRRYFGLDRLSLLGSSYHAAITALYALENPERVERLLLVCPITPAPPGSGRRRRRRPEVLIYPPGHPAARRDAAARGSTRATRWPSAAPGSTTSCCRPRWATWPRPRASRVDDVCSFPNEWPGHAMPLYFDHIIPKMKDWDFRPRLAALRAAGPGDAGDRRPGARRGLARVGGALRPNARFLRIEGAGHHPYLERPQEFFPAAESFLGGGWPQGAEIVRRAA